jgi:hypothetical protein
VSRSSFKKAKKFKVTPVVVIRLVIFFIVVYLLIIIFSSNNQTFYSSQSDDPTVFTNEIKIDSWYQKIPIENRQKIENLVQSSAIKFIQEKFDYLKQESQYFPQKQIKEIKKMIIQNIYHDMMNNIDQQ